MHGNKHQTLQTLTPPNSHLCVPVPPSIQGSVLRAYVYIRPHWPHMSSRTAGNPPTCLLSSPIINRNDCLHPSPSLLIKIDMLWHNYG